jgi:hypothetical protein
MSGDALLAFYARRRAAPVGGTASSCSSPRWRAPSAACRRDDVDRTANEGGANHG